ncbi:MAG: hypothetical protein JRF63_00025 [Deltaproteobacteria bacterium]|nr:hypothetical protein [Deltaproteobacteria bacterium]
MSALSSMLVQDQVLTVTQIEQALQRQVIYGGDLATNVLELGLVDEGVLADYMGRVARLPVIPFEHLSSLDQRVVKMLPWHVVNERHVVPVRIHGNSMIVATSGPLPAGALDEVSFLLGVEITPHLTLEFRLWMAMNRYYGIPVPARMTGLQRKLAPEFVPDQSPTVSPPGEDQGLLRGEDPRRRREPATADPESLSRGGAAADGKAPMLVVESSQPSREEDDADTTMRFFTMGTCSRSGPSRKDTSPMSAFGKPPGARETADIRDRQPQIRKPRRISFSKAMKLIQETETRDEILDLFLEFAGQAFDYTALFLIHGSTADVRSAMRRGEAPHEPGHVVVPLDSRGIFNTVHETNGFHLGPAGSGDADRQLLTQLDRGNPKSCAVIPVSLRQRMIMMLYGDSGFTGVRANRVAKIAEFAREVAAAFERILLTQKYGKFHKAKDAEIAKATPVEPPHAESKPPEEDDQLAKWAKEYRAAAAERLGKVRLTSVHTSPEVEKKLEADAWPEPSKSITSAPEPAVEPEPEPEPVPEPEPEPVPEPEVSPEPPAAAEESEVDEQATTLEAEPAVRVAPIAIVGSPEQRQISAPSETPTLRFRKPNPDLVQRVQTFTIGARSEPAQPSAFQPTPRPLPPNPDTAAAEPQPEFIETVPDSIATTETAPMDAVEEPIPLTDIASADTSPQQVFDGQTPPAGIATVDTEPIRSVPESTASRSVVVEMTEEIDRLVERVLNRGPFDQAAADLLVGIGDDALKKLISNFPGPLNCDRYQDLSRLRKVDQHGGLLKVLTMFGERVVPYLVPLLDSLDSEVRFYATFMFSEVRHPDALGALVHRIFDNDRQIRIVTMDVLRKFSDFPEYGWAMKELADNLAAPATTLENKRTTAEALGEIREPVAVKALAEMLGSVDGILAERCHRSLIKITFNDFGFSERRWLSWWHTNNGRHRIEWAIDSLTHRVEDIRRAAADELRRMVGGSVDWPSGPMDHKQRKELKRRLEGWWKREGRALHPVREFE